MRSLPASYSAEGAAAAQPQRQGGTDQVPREGRLDAFPTVRAHQVCCRLSKFARPPWGGQLKPIVLLRQPHPPATQDTGGRLHHRRNVCVKPPHKDREGCSVAMAPRARALVRCALCSALPTSRHSSECGAEGIRRCSGGSMCLTSPHQLYCRPRRCTAAACVHACTSPLQPHHMRLPSSDTPRSSAGSSGARRGGHAMAAASACCNHVGLAICRRIQWPTLRASCLVTT